MSKPQGTANMVRRIDDEAYAEGRKMFRKKATLRSILEPIILAAEAQEAENAKAGDDKPPPKRPTLEDMQKAREDERVQEARNLSRMLGFADAFLDHIRK